MKDIKLPETLKSIQFTALEGCSALESVKIPESVTEIGDRAFKNCDALTAVSIPDAVTNLGVGAFEDCNAVKNISIGNGLKEIGRFAFSDCTALESVRLGSSVATIGDCAFDGDVNIREITCLSPEPPVYSTGFPEEVILNATVNVPEGSEDAYNNDSTWAPMVEGDDTVIYNPVEDIQLGATSITLLVGRNYKLNVEVFPINANDPSVIWSSSDQGIASVSADGSITAVAAGHAVVTATAADGSGVNAVCDVNVVTFDTNGLDSVLADGGVWDVYGIDGSLIAKDCTPESIGSLKPGIYILRKGTHIVKISLR